MSYRALVCLCIFSVALIGGCDPGRCRTAPFTVEGIGSYSYFGYIRNGYVREFFSEDELVDITSKESVLRVEFVTVVDQFETKNIFRAINPISTAHALSCLDPDTINPVTSLTISLRAPGGGETPIIPTGFYANTVQNTILPIEDLESTLLLEELALDIDIDENSLPLLTAGYNFVVIIETKNNDLLSTVIPVIYSSY